MLLKRGSTGDEVTKLQKGLALIGFDPGAADGIFGPATETAVKELQKAAGIAVDGIYGPDTKAALKARRGDAKADKEAKKAKKAAKKAAKAGGTVADAGGDTTPM